MARTPKPWYRKERDAWFVMLDGRQVKLADGRRNKGAAVTEFHRLMTQRKEAAKRVGPALGVLCDLYYEHLEREKSPLHAETTWERLRKFSKHFGIESDSATIAPHQVTAWLATTKWNPTTRHGLVTSIKAMYAWGKRVGHLDANPLADLERPTPLSRQSIVAPDQARAIFAVVKDSPFRDFLTLLWETGIRPSEAMRLEAQMVNFDRGFIATVGKGRPRTIYLTPKAETLLRALALKHPEGPLLRNMRGRPWTRNATACRFGRLRKKLGFGPEATSESFRHLWITDALEKGIPIATVAELVGHKSTAMIERHYSKLAERKEHLASAVRKVRPGGG